MGKKNNTNWTTEEKEDFLKKSLSEKSGIDWEFLNNEKIEQALVKIHFLQQTHGSFNEIKTLYFKREPNERIAYLESVNNQFINLYEELELTNLTTYIQKNIDQIESKEFNRISDPEFFGTPLHVQLKNDFKPIGLFCETLIKLQNFYKSEIEIKEHKTGKDEKISTLKDYLKSKPDNKEKIDYLNYFLENNELKE